MLREQIFKKNYIEYLNHNFRNQSSPHHTYTTAINKFSDMVSYQC